MKKENLKDKEKTLPYWVKHKENTSTKYVRSEDIKEKILKFENEMDKELFCLMSDEDICMDAHNLNELILKFKEIFGEWKE